MKKFTWQKVPGGLKALMPAKPTKKPAKKPRKPKKPKTNPLMFKAWATVDPSDVFDLPQVHPTKEAASQMARCNDIEAMPVIVEYIRWVKDDKGNVARMWTIAAQ